jgi:hypothetical protein
MDVATAQSLKAERNSKPRLMRWKPQHKKAGDDFCQASCSAKFRARFYNIRGRRYGHNFLRFSTIFGEKWRFSKEML